MKKVRALKFFEYKGMNIRPGFRVSMPDTTAREHIAKGDVEILLIPENRTKK